MKPAVAFALAAMLAGCSTLGSGAAPGCHGPRRPANPNGSVLATSGPAEPATPAPAPLRGGPCGGARP